LKSIIRFSFIVVLCFAVMLSSAGCAKIEKVKTTALFDENFTKKSDDSGVVCENDSYILKWNKEAARVELLEKSSGYTWSNLPQELIEPRYDADGDVISNNVLLEAPIMVDYCEASTGNNKTANAYTASVKKKNFKTEKIENGIKITYYFVKEEFSVPVSYVLGDSSLKISIDTTEIAESENKICSVRIAPFFCSVKNLSDGYLFYPSGSGAIIEADSQPELSVTLSAEVYGEDLQRYPDSRLDYSNTMNIKMPVFGVSDGVSKGMAAIISEGAAAASVVLTRGNENIGFSGISASFTLRSYQRVAALTTTWRTRNTIYADYMYQGTLAVEYYPLTGENASYVGMANCYREYLAKTYGFSKKSDDALYSVNILGGAMIDKSLFGIPYSALYAATTTEQAKEIVSDLIEKTERIPVTDLHGFGESGITVGKIAGGGTVSNKLGGESGIKELAKWCSSNDVPLYMDFDLLRYSKTGNGVPFVKGAAIATNYRATMQYWYNVGTKAAKTGEDKYYYVRRDLVPQIAESTLKKANKFGLSGIALNTLSNSAYSDYYKAAYYSKGSTEKDVSEILKNYTENNKAIYVNSANDYAAVYATHIADAPTQSNKSNVFSYDVPFYEIVFKGYTAMTSTALNLSIDENEMLLRAAESGIGISFTLASEHTTNLNSVRDEAFWGTVYSEQSDNTVRIIKEYAEYFDKVSGAEIVNHTICENGLRITEFDNGVRTYINYTDETLTAPDGLEIPATAFVYR